MTIEEKLALLQPGDILIERTHGWFGIGLNMLMPGKGYQHCKTVWKDSNLVIEDGDKGVAFKSSLDQLEHCECWRPKCSEEHKKLSLDNMSKRIGEVYGFIELLATYLRKRLRIIVPDMPGADCSEFIAECYLPNYRLTDLLPEDTAPWDLRNPDTLERIF